MRNDIVLMSSKRVHVIKDQVCVDAVLDFLKAK